MTCAACGSVLAQDVRFCPRCGAPVTLQAPPPGYSYPAGPPLPYTRVGRHLQALGILWLVYAAMRAVTGLLGVIFLHGLFGAHHYNGWNFGWGPFDNSWLAALWPVALGSLVISAGISVLVGCALLTRQSWARVLAIIFSVIALIHFPLGTALGIYTLWVLAPRASGYEFAVIAAAQNGV